MTKADLIDALIALRAMIDETLVASGIDPDEIPDEEDSDEEDDDDNANDDEDEEELVA